MMRGDPEEVVDAYMDFLKIRKSAAAQEEV